MADDDGGAGKHIAAARSRLGHLAELSARTEAAERKILATALARLAEVEHDVATLRPRAVADEAAGERYTAAVTERGTLHKVIAQARAVLGEDA